MLAGSERGAEGDGGPAPSVGVRGVVEFPMRSPLLRAAALLSALGVLTALVVHSGCSRPGSATPDPATSAVAGSAGAGSAGAGPAGAGPAAAGPALPRGEVPPSTEDASINSVRFMGASKSGTIIHAPKSGGASQGNR